MTECFDRLRGRCAGLLLLLLLLVVIAVEPSGWVVGAASVRFLDDDEGKVFVGVHHNLMLLGLEAEELQIVLRVEVTNERAGHAGKVWNQLGVLLRCFRVGCCAQWLTIAVEDHCRYHPL